MKIIHTADLHLCLNMTNSSLPIEISQLHRKQLWDTFYNIIKITKEENGDILIISGDLCEMKYAKGSDIKRIFDAFSLIPNTQVFIACGNHDYLAHNCFYNAVEPPTNVTIFPDELSIIQLNDLGVNVYGFSWSRNKYESIPFDIPDLDKSKKNILCLHADVLTDSDYMPINLKMLENIGFDYIALGHIHKKNFITETIAYPGSPEPLDFGEDGSHGVIIAEINDAAVQSRFVPCAKHRFVSCEIDITEMDNYNDIVHAIKSKVDGGTSDIVRCSIIGTCQWDIEIENIKEMMGCEYLHLQITDRTTKNYDLVKIYRENQDNIIGKFVAELMNDAREDETAKIALYAGLEALLGNGGVGNDNQKN